MLKAEANQMNTLTIRRCSVNNPSRKELYPFANFSTNNQKPLTDPTRSSTIQNLIKLYHGKQDYDNEEVTEVKPKYFKTDFISNANRKVTFQDKKLLVALVEVKDIESYKIYNLVNTYKTGASSAGLSCCMIF